MSNERRAPGGPADPERVPMSLERSGSAWTIVPPPADHCPVCAGIHEPDQPHNPESLYWQIVFSQVHGRYPTWLDALAHCTPAVQAAVRAALAERGLDLDAEYEAAVAAGRHGSLDPIISSVEEVTRGEGGNDGQS